MNRGRRNGTRQQQRRNRVSPQVTALKRNIEGCQFVPSPDPPTIVDLPYNSLVCEFTNLGGDGLPDKAAVQVTVENVREYIKTKVGLSDTANIKLKVHKTTHYVTADGNGFIRPTLRSQVYELTQSGSATSRVDMSDKGDLNSPAKAGYHWPMVDKKDILTSTNDSTLITACLGSSTTTGGTTTYSNVLVRLYVLWRASGP